MVMREQTEYRHTRHDIVPPATISFYDLFFFYKRVQFFKTLNVSFKYYVKNIGIVQFIML